MSFSFKDKIILITGANRGIGEGFVKTFLEEGAKTIYAAARQMSSLDDIVKLNPDVIKPIELDVTKPEQIKAVAESIDALDVLINNAGMIDSTRCSAADATEYARIEMEVNLFGPMQLTSALVPLIKQSSEGAIINLASIVAITNLPSIGTYSVSKAAMQSYTQGLRADLGKEGITVACVFPGPTDTRMAANMPLDKPEAISVAHKLVQELNEGVLDIFPDNFAKEMYKTALSDPKKIAEIFTMFG